MASELISVIVPTWQRASFIDACLDAIVTQEGVDLEVLVCDDGSTDDTKERVAARNDARVRHLALEHSGLPAVARNFGVRAARGELLAFCDSDDLWHPGHLARLSAGLRRVPAASLVMTRSRLIRPDGVVFGEHPVIAEASDDVPLARLVIGNVLPMSGAFARRADVLAVGGFPEDPRAKAVEDYGLWLALAQRGKVVILPELDIDHVRHEGSLSMNGEVRESHGIIYLMSLMTGPGVPARAVRRTRSAMHHRLSRALWPSNKLESVRHELLRRWTRWI
ncbi:MAG TPA: glycosyltransferase family A protein [Byssovorax sp.]|jgi:glycosyltransferase involved in cell wall biosynthesis